MQDFKRSFRKAAVAAAVPESEKTEQMDLPQVLVKPGTVEEAAMLYGYLQKPQTIIQFIMGTVATAVAVAVAVVLPGILQAVLEALAALVDMVVEAVTVETDASSSTIKAVKKC